MSRFSEELKVIPNAARITAGLVYAASLVMWSVVFTFSHDQGLQSTPEVGKVALTLFPGLVLAICVLLIGYVNGDAKRRGMPYVMWTLLALFIPDGIGIILYFILRKPMPRPCPGCSQEVPSGFVFCPHCGTPLQPTCPSCGHAVERGWANCPSCGTKLPSLPGRAA